MTYQISDRERQILRELRRLDPDGQPTEPTDEKRQGFRDWIRHTQGEQIESLYFDHDWDPVVTTWGTGDFPVPHPR